MTSTSALALQTEPVDREMVHVHGLNVAVPPKMEIYSLTKIFIPQPRVILTEELHEPGSDGNLYKVSLVACRVSVDLMGTGSNLPRYEGGIVTVVELRDLSEEEIKSREAEGLRFPPVHRHSDLRADVTALAEDRFQPNEIADRVLRRYILTR